MSGLNPSGGDKEQVFMDLMDDDDSLGDDEDVSFEEEHPSEDSDGDQVVLDFAETDNVRDDDVDIAAEVVVGQDDSDEDEDDDDYYPIEKVLVEEVSVYPDVHINNMPIVFMEDGHNMNVDVLDSTEGTEGGDDSGDWLAEGQLGARGRVRGARGRGVCRGLSRGKGRGQGQFLDRGESSAVDRGLSRGRVRGRGGLIVARGDGAWKRGNILSELYANDADIPEEVREQLQPPSTGSAAAGRGRGRGIGGGSGANETGANAEGADDELLDDGGMVDDIMNEFKTYCKSDESTFEWKTMASFPRLRVRQMLQVDRTGPTHIFHNAYDAFREYWDDAIVQHIVDSTNVYGDAVPETERTFHKHWYHTNVHEILTLFAFWMMLGIVRMPTIKSCFSNENLLKTNVFRMLFAEGRYWSLNRALRFAPNETLDQNADKLRDIRPILTHLNRKFKECYVPSQDISIDESLTLWKGNITFRQYKKNKAGRFGIKTYELCESSTGYLWSFFIYTGKASEKELSSMKAVKIILRLILPLLGKGYRVFVDNFFNSPLLARFLKRRQTDCVGTVKRTRKHIPPLIKKCILPKGSYLARHADDVIVLSLADTKPLVMISTHHGAEQTRTAERPGHSSEYKFKAVADYNIGMGAVGKKDQMLEPYLMERKQCKRWFNKFFKRLLNVTILNSRILVEKSGGNAKVPLAFRLELVNEIIQRHMPNLPRPQRAPVTRAGGNYPPINENIYHFVKKIDALEDRKISRRCRWCRDQHNKRSRTSYECEVCEIPLCLFPCFKEFHTQR